MAPRPAILLVLLLAAFISSSYAAAIFRVINWCLTTVYTAGTDSSNGSLAMGLLPRDELHFVMSAGINGRIWGRTGGSFDVDGNGHCETGDCAGQLICNKLPENWKPSATMAEYILGDDLDYHDISVVDGFNIPMAFGCRDTAGPGLRCMDPGCPDAKHLPDDDGKIHTCNANSSYYIVFCPV